MFRLKQLSMLFVATVGVIVGGGDRAGAITTGGADDEEAARQVRRKFRRTFHHKIDWSICRHLACMLVYPWNQAAFIVLERSLSRPSFLYSLALSCPA